MPITNIKGDETAIIKRYRGDFSVSRVNNDFDNYYIHCNNNIIEINKILSKDKLGKILQIRLLPNQNKITIARGYIISDINVEQHGKKFLVNFAVNLGHYFALLIEQLEEKKYHFKIELYSITDEIFHFDTTEIEFDYEFYNPNIIYEEW